MPNEGTFFSIEPVEGKGLGAVATRDIPRGERIVAEVPVISCHAGSHGGGDASYSWHEDIQRQFDALPAERQDDVMSLHDVCLVGAEKTPQGVVFTNAFAREGGAFDAALCLTMSRFNHSCLPNCEQSWDARAGEGHIYASAPVGAGEELCYYYTDLRAPRAERAQKLWDQYRFRCTCRACAGGGTDGDRRREQLRKLHHEFDTAGVQDPEHGMQTALAILDLYEEEGLHLYSHRKWVCRTAFELALILGDLPRARRWAERSHEYSLLCHGPDHRDTLWALQFARRPERHPAFAGYSRWVPTTLTAQQLPRAPGPRTVGHSLQTCVRVFRRIFRAF